MERLLSFLLCIFILTGCASNQAIADYDAADTSKAVHHTTKGFSHPLLKEPATDEAEAETEASTTSAIENSNETVTTVTEPITETPAVYTTETAVDTHKPTEAQTAPTQPAEATPSAEPPAPASPEEYLNLMSAEELVGQMILARHPVQGAVDDITSYHLGGYILFARDFENETPDSIKTKLGEYNSASRIPMLFAVDEEGGTVTRVSKFSAFRQAPFPSPRELFNSGGMSIIRQNEREKARLLRSIGINTNFAPVCDITTDPKAFMYNRSLGQSPEITADFVRTAVAEAAAENVGCVLKHFPGYGNNADTHTGIARDGRSKEELCGCDLVPFQAGIDADVGAVLVSHTIIEAIDTAMPATLSPAVHSLLRNEMGFGGVIVTDDLSMQAVASLYGTGEAAVLAVLAGNDILCSTDYRAQYLAVLNAVRDGRIPLETVKSAALRVLKWKDTLGLLP